MPLPPQPTLGAPPVPPRTIHRDAATLYEVAEWPLKYAQTAAVLEIFHSAFRLVPAALGTTFVQVFSRLFVLWTITSAVEAAQVTPFFADMAVSWALVEVPKYTVRMVVL